MSINVVPLNEADPAGVCELLVRSWKCDWGEELLVDYLAWRYGARGRGETLLACDGPRCVGILDSFIRPYWIAGRQEMVRETCDWFCLPEYRAFGVGLYLMRRMMARPEPILSIGGTEFTLDLLPRLKWAQLPRVDNFVLPVSSRAAAALISTRVLGRRVDSVQGVPEFRLVRNLPHHPPPTANAEVRAFAPSDQEEVPNGAPYALTPSLDTAVLNWLAHAPAVLGEFGLLSFFCDGEHVGISISRLEKLRWGCKARIIHLHPTRFEVIAWMVSETVHHLLERGAGAVLYRASCPKAGSALTELGFIRGPSIPAYWWPSSKQPPAGLFHLTSLQADNALLFG
jgi:hypothetical protein